MRLTIAILACLAAGAAVSASSAASVSSILVIRFRQSRGYSVVQPEGAAANMEGNRWYLHKLTRSPVLPCSSHALGLTPAHVLAFSQPNPDPATPRLARRVLPHSPAVDAAASKSAPAITAAPGLRLRQRALNHNEAEDAELASILSAQAAAAAASSAKRGGVTPAVSVADVYVRS